MHAPASWKGRQKSVDNVGSMTPLNLQAGPFGRMQFGAGSASLLHVTFWIVPYGVLSDQREFSTAWSKNVMKENPVFRLVGIIRIV
jgi:hypothetical protein